MGGGWGPLLRLHRSQCHHHAMPRVVQSSPSWPLCPHLHPSSIHFFKKLEVKFSYRDIIHFKANNSVAFRTLTMLGICPLYLVPKHFSSPKLGTGEQFLLTSPALQLQATANLPPVSVDLPPLDISSKWNHAVCGLLCPASSTERVFKAHPGKKFHVPEFLPFVRLNNIPLSVYILHFVYLLAHPWTLGLLPSLLLRTESLQKGGTRVWVPPFFYNSLI